jgi:hypothetical protein
MIVLITLIAPSIGSDYVVQMTIPLLLLLLLLLLHFRRPGL